MRKPLALALTLSACGPPMEEQAAREAVEAAFTAGNPPGRTGLELRGKTNWFVGNMFYPPCLEEKDLAFNDNPDMRPDSAKSTPRVTPTYQNQRWITASTANGFCVYLGDDPKLTIGAGEVDGPKWVGDRWRVPIKLSMGAPSPWFECLAESSKTRIIDVIPDADGGAPKLEGKLDVYQGDCPNPLPGGMERTPRVQPTASPPGAPSSAQVVAAAEALDDKLRALDYAGAVGEIACYNLYEEQKFGTCSAAELVATGPQPTGERKPEFGTPWLEYAIMDFSELGKPVRDSKDPTLYHVMLKHARTGQTRSISVQWDGGRWKIVGVVMRKAAGITQVRFLLDLHDRAVRDIFKRRMEGEQIDEKGYPLDPFAEEQE